MLARRGVAFAGFFTWRCFFWTAWKRIRRGGGAGDFARLKGKKATARTARLVKLRHGREPCLLYLIPRFPVT